MNDDQFMGLWIRFVGGGCTNSARQLSYPNFVRGPLLGGMQLVFGHFEVLGTHH